MEVQKIIKSDGLLANVRAMGELLSRLLWATVADHPNVGDVRGRGLFWAVEFVRDKENKFPFGPGINVAMELSELGLTEKYGIAVYPGNGTADGLLGDHIIIAPAYNVTGAEVEAVVRTLQKLIVDYFASLSRASAQLVGSNE